MSSSRLASRAKNISFQKRTLLTPPVPINRYGPGGRHSNSGLTVTVFGSYGFIGKYFCSELGGSGTRVYAPFRGDELEMRPLKPMFDLGQLGLLPFSVRDKDSVREAFRNTDVVVNLIGKHFETKHAVPTRRADGKLSRVNFSFEEVHVTAAETIAEVAKEAGVKKFIQVSALSADAKSESRWCKSKAQGEAAVRKHFPDAIVVRPATVFGPEDRFLNWIAETNTRLPILPLINNGANVLQPVYVADVGKALAELCKNYDTFAGRTFQLTGPAEYTYKELAEFVQDVTLVRKPLVDIPINVATFAGKFIEELVHPVLSVDAVVQLQHDIVEKKDASLLTLKDLEIEPVSLDRIAFDYLHRFRKGGHFTLVQGYH